jgi:fructose/tagatose bisphosphate aldolase
LALRDVSVPVSFLLNESDSVPQIREALDLGFNAVMVENERLTSAGYCQLVREVVGWAHARGALVEAQIGHLPYGYDGVDDGKSELTDPVLASQFVRETGVDALAVSVGNVHIVTKGRAALDLDALARIHERIHLPLVLHGGTGLTAANIAQAIRLGVAKLNFGTVLKQRFLAAMREKLAAYHEPMNPHPFLGMGGDEDVLAAGREAMAEQVRALLESSGAAGKAGGLEHGAAQMSTGD